MAEGYSGVSINPRDYQRLSLQKVWGKWGKINPETKELYKKLLLVLPTGTGKTMVFSLLTNHVVKNEGAKVLILAHRAELITQAQDKLLSSTGIDSAMEKARSTGHDSFHDVVVGSVQTLSATRRLNRYDKDHFDYIIVDETHRILADTYQRILNYFGSAKVLGVTATPQRGDKKSLGEYFEDIPFEYRLKEAINDGWLTPIVAETCPVRIDLSSANVNCGEYSAEDVESAITPHLIEIVREIKARAGDRKTVIFLPLVHTSKTMAKLLTEAGIESKSIDGTMKTEERDAVKEWFVSSGKGTCICNSMLLTEGYDQPDIDCIIVLRATQSSGLYRQMIGRGTRVLDPRINEEGLTRDDRKRIIAMSDKKDMKILDFLWLTSQHRVCSPSSLVATSKVSEESGREFVNNGGGVVSLDDIESAVDEAKRMEEVNKRENAMADKIDGLSGKRSLSCDPVMQALSLFDDTIINLEESANSPVATEAQVRALTDYGLKNSEEWSSNLATKMLAVIKHRREKQLASPKQLAMLTKYGIPNAPNKTFDQASFIIDNLAKSWKKKRGNRRGR